MIADPAMVDQRNPVAFLEFTFGVKVKGVQIPEMFDKGCKVVGGRTINVSETFLGPHGLVTVSWIIYVPGVE